MASNPTTRNPGQKDNERLWKTLGEFNPALTP